MNRRCDDISVSRIYCYLLQCFLVSILVFFWLIIWLFVIPRLFRSLAAVLVTYVMRMCLSCQCAELAYDYFKFYLILLILSSLMLWSFFLSGCTNIAV